MIFDLLLYDKYSSLALITFLDNFAPPLAPAAGARQLEFEREACGCMER